MRDVRDDGAMTWTAPEVTREEFPLDLPERDGLEGFIAWHRQTLLWKVAGLTGRQLVSHAIPTSNVTLLGIVRHMAQVERHWWRHRVAGEDIPNLYLDDDEWSRLDPDRAAEDYQQLLDEWPAVDAVAARYGLDHTFDRAASPGRSTHAAPALDRGMGPPQRPHRPDPRGDRRCDRRVTPTFRTHQHGGIGTSRSAAIGSAHGRRFPCRIRPAASWGRRLRPASSEQAAFEGDADGCRTI
jgi:Protein of unknown function (DUF664)